MVYSLKVFFLLSSVIAIYDKGVFFITINESTVVRIFMPSSFGTEKQISIYHTLFENTHEGIIITDENCIIQKINPAFSLITGYTSEEAIGKKPSFLKSGRHDKHFYEMLWSKLQKIGRWNGFLWDRRKNGEVFPIELTITAVKNGIDNKNLYLGILTDQSNKEEKQCNKSNYDPLTTLPNRILFRDHLSFMLAHAKRNDQILALLLLDLNRFKVMNETLGFNAGDMILMNTAERLKKALREVDAVFRLGNDEFAIILEEVSKIEDAAKVAKKILRTFSLPFKLSYYEDELYISASIGISIFPQDGSNYEEIIKNAETAMYQAKELEQNNFQHYSPAMNASTFEHLTMEHQLYKALEQREFIVYYQPIVDIPTSSITGAEALVRWHHPELGLVSPAEFIPIAEETGLIIPIGEHVMRCACEKAKEWQSKGHNNFHISVNLSARQFQQHDLIQKVEIILLLSDLAPQSLELEITESIGMKNAEHTIQILDELKQKGIRISIDDFGTGYSSLSYLKKFPIDTLKIDQSFVRDIGEEEDSETIVSLIISMAHTLKLRVVAEGVETKKQLAFLKEQKCDLLQGYLFSKPVPAEQFEKLLLDYKKKSRK